MAEAAAREHERHVAGIDFFGVATILRSLILFNLLFAVQTVLDVIYLWGNATLPADISYATMRIAAPIPSSSRRCWPPDSFWQR